MSDLGPEDLLKLVRLAGDGAGLISMTPDDFRAYAHTWQRDREQLAREQAAVDWAADWFGSGDRDDLPPKVRGALKGREQGRGS